MDLLNIGGIVDAAKGIFDDLHMSGEERADKEAQLERILTDGFVARTKMVAEIVKAENQSGDSFTRRARPAVVWTGLLAIIWNYVAMPTISHLVKFFADTSIDWTPVALPTDFWIAWGGIVATWSIGRSMERRSLNMNKPTSKLMEMING